MVYALGRGNEGRDLCRGGNEFRGLGKTWTRGGKREVSLSYGLLLEICVSEFRISFYSDCCLYSPHLSSKHVKKRLQQY